MSQQAGLEEEPPRKVRRIVPEMVGKIINVMGEDDPDAPTIIKITPGMNPYSQLDLEEEELSIRLVTNLLQKYTLMTMRQMTYPA